MSTGVVGEGQFNRATVLYCGDAKPEHVRYGAGQISKIFGGREVEYFCERLMDSYDGRSQTKNIGQHIRNLAGDEERQVLVFTHGTGVLNVLGAMFEGDMPTLKDRVHIYNLGGVQLLENTLAGRVYNYLFDNDFKGGIGRVLIAKHHDSQIENIHDDPNGYPVKRIDDAMVILNRMGYDQRVPREDEDIEHDAQVYDAKDLRTLVTGDSNRLHPDHQRFFENRHVAIVTRKGAKGAWPHVDELGVWFERRQHAVGCYVRALLQGPGYDNHMKEDLKKVLSEEWTPPTHRC